jgi:hypothetical protein
VTYDEVTLPLRAGDLFRVLHRRDLRGGKCRRKEYGAKRSAMSWVKTARRTAREIVDAIFDSVILFRERRRRLMT